MFDTLGWIFGPLFVLLSILLAAMSIFVSSQLRMGRAIPPVFLEEVTDLVNRRAFNGAFDLVHCDNSFLSRVLHDGMSSLPLGLEAAREAVFSSVESRKSRMNILIGYLATIGTLGPTVGMLATVYAMILVAGIGQPGQLAVGVNHAIAVTLAGIAISIPAIFVHAIFKNRLVRVAMEVATISDQLITQMCQREPPDEGPEASSIVPRSSPPSGFPGANGAIPEIDCP